MVREPKDKPRPSRRSSDDTTATNPDSVDPSSATPNSLSEDSDPRVPSLVQMNLLASVQGMHDLAAKDAEVQALWSKHLQNVQAALRFVSKRFPSEPSAAPTTPDEGAIDPEQVSRFGALVEQLRKGADMSREKLAKRAGLSPQTVYNVETASNVPTHETIVRLLAVKELGLRGDQIPWQDSAAGQRATGPNCWLAPGYDPLKMFTELFELVNGHGGALEQTYAYLDHKSAMNWYALSNQGPFAAAFRANMPLQKAAQ